MWIRLAIVVPIGLLTAATPALRAQAPRDVAMVVEAVARGGEPRLASYQAVRRLEAATRGGRLRATMTVRTTLDDRGFRFETLDATGSPTIQRRVFLSALEAERVLVREDGPRRGALSEDNYAFTWDQPGTGASLVPIAIQPKRREPLLIDGVMWVSRHDLELVRIEGVLVKRPSFWTRRVAVTRDYARVNGVRVPVALRSVANVLVVGMSTFEMRYTYEAINGHRVPASAPMTLSSDSTANR